MTAAGRREAVASFDLADRAPVRRAGARGARRGARGDRRAQRLPGARRRHRHQHVPHLRGRPRARCSTRCDGPARSDLRVAMTAFARGALLGARGNSGVILSQLVGALLQAARGGRAGRPLRGGVRRRAGAGHRGRLRRRRPARRGHHLVGRAGGGRGGRRGRRRRRQAARPRDPRRGRGRPRGPGPHARAAADAARTPGSSTPAAAGCAWCSTPPRRP